MASPSVVSARIIPLVVFSFHKVFKLYLYYPHDCPQPTVTVEWFKLGPNQMCPLQGGIIHKATERKTSVVFDEKKQNWGDGWRYSRGQPKPACLLAPEDFFLAPNRLQIRTRGTQKRQKMASADFSHDFLGTAKFWAQKFDFIASMHPFCTNFWLLVMLKSPPWLLRKMDVMPWLKGGVGEEWRVQDCADGHFAVLQIIMHCHRFTLNGSYCVVIYARTCNIFVILTLRPNSGIKKELIAHFSVFLAKY